MSAARVQGRTVRGPKPPVQPVNEFLESMREDWDDHDAAGKVDYIRRELDIIANPVELLDEFDHITYADYTLGELHHARVVLTRVLSTSAEF